MKKGKGEFKMKMIKKTIMVICCLGLLMFGVARTSFAITNGSFETGDFTGWTPNGLAYITTGVLGYAPVDGAYFAYLAGGSAWVYQTITQTIFSIVAGESIDGYAAFYATDYVGDNAYVKIFDLSYSLIATPWYKIDYNIGTSTPWENWSWTASASGNYILQFGVQNVADTLYTPYALFDDVGGGGIPGVPEPTSMVLLGLGLIGLAGIRRKYNH